MNNSPIPPRPVIDMSWPGGSARFDTVPEMVAAAVVVAALHAAVLATSIITSLTLRRFFR